MQVTPISDCPPVGVNGAASVVAHAAKPGQRVGIRRRKCKPHQLDLIFPSLDFSGPQPEFCKGLKTGHFHPTLSQIRREFDPCFSSDSLSRDAWHGSDMDAPDLIPRGGATTFLISLGRPSINEDFFIPR